MLTSRPFDRPWIAVLALVAGIACPTAADAAPAGQPDARYLPRTRTAPVVDGSAGEWSAEGRVAPSGGEAGAFVRSGGGG